MPDKREACSSPRLKPFSGHDQLLEIAVAKLENPGPADRRAAIGDANPNLKAAWPGRLFDKPKARARGEQGRRHARLPSGKAKLASSRAQSERTRKRRVKQMA
jgi:hypothetical protein